MAFIVAPRMAPKKRPASNISMDSMADRVVKARTSCAVDEFMFALGFLNCSPLSSHKN